MKLKLNYIYILIAACLWGSTGIFINLLSEYGLTTGQLSGIRAGLNAVIIGLFLLITDKSKLNVKPHDLWVFVGTGLLSFAFFTYCYYTSIKLNGMAVAAVLLYTAPIFVAIMSAIIFKNKITLPKTIAIILSVLGCAAVSGLFSQNSSVISSIGILAGIGSGLGYALYSIFGKFAIDKKYESITITFYTFLFASIVAVPQALADKFPKVTVDFKFIFIILAYVFITGILPYVFYTKGLEKTEPSFASLIATLEPVVAALLGMIIFGEILTIPMILGIIMIFISLVIVAVL